MLPWKKTRTRIGMWMDERNLTQEWLVKEAGLSRNTVSELCGNIEYRPRVQTRTNVIRALRQIDPNVSAPDFW